MSTHASTQPRERQEWMDVFRGGAIILVVLWHAPAIPVLLGYDVPHWLVTLDNAFLPFRMPGLMFLSGLLLQRSLSKPLLDYYWGKARAIAWPYLCWGALHMILWDLPWPWYHWRAWYGIGYLWFLFFILVYYAVAPAVRRAPPWTTVVVPLVVASLMADSKDQRLVYFAAFFFAGYAATCYPRVFEAAQRRSMLALWVVLAATGAVIAAINGVASAYHPFLAPTSLGGILVLARLSRFVQTYAWTRGLKVIGRNSIVYYVSHFPIILGVVHVMRTAGIESGVAMAAVGLVFALIGGWLLVRLRPFPPIGLLFDFPDLLALRRRRARARPAR